MGGVFKMRIFAGNVIVGLTYLHYKGLRLAPQ
jgi:hypothetical protein